MTYFLNNNETKIDWKHLYTDKFWSHFLDFNNKSLSVISLEIYAVSEKQLYEVK